MKRFRLPVLIFVLLFAVILGRSLFRSRPPAAPAVSKGVAVTAYTVIQRDLPVWLSGIGAVQASNTVTVRPRVSGELKTVNFTEGQEVKAGDVLAEIDPRPYRAALDLALAKQAQDAAQNANDRRELERIRSLVESNTESRQLLDQRQSSVAQSGALVQAAQAAVDSARLDLDFTTVRAPIGGHTGVRLVDSGNLVTASQSTGLVVLTQTRPISLVFSVPQQNFLSIRRSINAAGSTALAVQALDDAGTVLASGHLELIDNQIDTSTGTLRLKATFPNDDQILWPGQFVNARVQIQTVPNAVVVPAEAVLPGLNGPYAYVIKADSTVEARTLKIGPTADSTTVVETGLQPGENIVREGQNKLQPGARVEIVKTAASIAVE